MIHECTRTKEDIYSTASSSEASDSLVFLYKFVEHEAKINIEISRDVLVFILVITRTIGIIRVAFNELGCFDNLAFASCRHCNMLVKH